MIRRRYAPPVLCLIAMLSLAGCTQTPPKEASAVSKESPVAWDSFGAPIAEASPIPVTQVLAAPEQYAGRSILVEGTVAEVCQNKGCWMTMQGADGSMRVRFKDYAYFVPKDCSGRVAHIEGVLSVEMTPVEEARHYLLDAGKQDEAAKITEPVRTVTFMASGVRLKVREPSRS